MARRLRAAMAVPPESHPGLRQGRHRRRRRRTRARCAVARAGRLRDARAAGLEGRSPRRTPRASGQPAQTGNALAIVPIDQEGRAARCHARRAAHAHQRQPTCAAISTPIEVRVPGAPHADEIVFILDHEYRAARARTRRRPGGVGDRQVGRPALARTSETTRCPHRSASSSFKCDETRIEMGQADRPADAPRARDGGDRQPLCRPLCREARRADRDRRGARRPARRRSASRRSASQPGQAQSYGKAAIVGEAGELEHAAAILHPKLGAPLRKAVEKGAALVPSAKKRGGARHRDRRAARPQGRRLRAQPFRRDRGARRPMRRAPTRSWSRSSITDSGRPLARIGGLQVSEIKGEDGLR